MLYTYSLYLIITWRLVMKTIYETSTETAKKIRARLKKEYPDLPKSHFKVKTKNYSGGSSITVSWVDYPIEKEVSEVIDQYKSTTFDGMQDLAEHHGYIDPEDGLLYSGADYIFANFSLSDARYDKLVEIINEKYPEGFDPNDYWLSNKRLHEVNKTLDYHMKTKPEYESLKESVEEHDFKKDKAKYIDFYLNNFPIHLYNLGLGADLLGKVNQGARSQVLEISSQLGFREYFKSQFEKELTEELLMREYKYSMNKHEYDKAVYNLFCSIYQNKMSKTINNTMIKHLKNLYRLVVMEIYNSIKDKPKDTVAFKKEIWEKTNLLSDEFKSADSYFFYFLNYADYPDNTQKVMTEYVKDTIIKVLKSWDVTESEFSESNIIKQIGKYYLNATDADKIRINRILSKNNEEMKKLITGSPYVIYKDLYILKIPTNKNVEFYQTPYGMWALETAKDSNGIEKQQFRTIYRLGVDPIKDCLKKLVLAANYYALPEICLAVAEKMYLR